MNRTQHGNIAVGAPNSLARAQANENFLAEKLALMTVAAMALLDEFTPNDERHPAIQAFNQAMEFGTRKLVT